MPTKTDRILSYLPRTFEAFPRPSALYSLVDAFGNELLAAENSLAALMCAHWVDHADRGAEFIDDLARIAALYGLAPRLDESVEEFREHLKRYIRTFLEGTVTVQGILRITAEALGLHIADSYEKIDSWWKRSENELITIEPCGNDAAELLLGIKEITATGRSATPAQLTGSIDLSKGVDLRETSILRIKIDNHEPVDIDLIESVENPALVKLDEIKTTIENKLPDIIVQEDGKFLTLASPTIGPDSKLEIQDVEKDAAEKILGLVPRTYHGSKAKRAQVTGTVDLSAEIDMGQNQDRYIRLCIDGTYLAEIDCAGTDPAHTTLNDICDAINTALEELPDFPETPEDFHVATHDDYFITLTSPTEGSTSSIAFQQPAAQNATESLFGPVNSFYLGQDAQPVRATGRRDLRNGLDLSERSYIQLRINDAASVTIDCAGEEPANTRIEEIVAAINSAFGKDVKIASHNGRFVTLTSPTEGPEAKIAFETPSEKDATEDIFGIPPRSFTGNATTAARIIGIPDLSSGVNLWAFHLLRLAVDGGTPLEIDFWKEVEDPGVVTLSDLTNAINTILGINIASDDGHHLILTSTTIGSASSLTIEPLEIKRRRRFVTRAIITDEAAQKIFGFVSCEARGTGAKPARIKGKVDLSRGVDLQTDRYLRVSIDNQPAIDIDCAGRRPRATLINEVVEAINTTLEINIAAHDGKRLVLTSPAAGIGSRIAFESPRINDALDKLLGVEPGTFRGQEATPVHFVGTTDLSEGIELPKNAAIKLGINGADPVNIVFESEGDEPAQYTLSKIVITINLALNSSVATHDGKHLILSFPLPLSSGMSSRIDFVNPEGQDVTKDLFGITPPRSYQGKDAVSAQIVGNRDLSSNVNLEVAHFLRFSIDGQPAVDVDCAAKASDPAAATLDEIKEAINDALSAEVASHNGTNLILKSVNTGLSGRITLEPYTSGDARPKLLGDIADVTEGSDPAPASITGEVDLLTPVDLSQRRVIRLAVDGGRPVDIDVAGAAPEATFLDEIVAAINVVFPNMAAATEDDHVQLTSPTAGEDSYLALLPPRYLELIEYPPEPTEMPSRAVRHGDRWTIDNQGAAEVFAEITLTAPQGEVGPTLVNMSLGWQIRLLTALAAGEEVKLWRDEDSRLKAEITGIDGDLRPVPGSKILIGPLGTQAWVPFEGEWHLSGNTDNPATLQLNNPLASNIVVLQARQPSPENSKISVTVTESDLISISPEAITADKTLERLVGRVRLLNGVFRLVAPNEDVIADLRAGAGVELAAFQDRVVRATGPLHVGEPPVMIVEKISRIFNVTLRQKSTATEQNDEHYTGVTIGVGIEEPDSLVRQINVGPHASNLVKAEEVAKGTVLILPRGRSEWVYLNCYSSRYNQARFDKARFAGGRCRERGVFNISRFVNAPPELVAAEFATSGEIADPPVEVSFQWMHHRPGAFEVHLPADLPERFGGRFNEARFGRKGDSPEQYEKVVTEPPDDDHHIVRVINEGSTLVEAEMVPLVPLGWEPVQMPFRKPRFLTLGDEKTEARIYLTEEGVDEFIELRACEKGQWGNKISVVARKAGPAMFDVTINFEGGRFESARRIVLGEPLPDLVSELLKPGSIGVLQAKAAGVQASVSRDGTPAVC